MQGYPYEQIIFGQSHSCTDTLHELVHNEGYRDRLDNKINQHSKDLEPLYALGFHGLDALVKNPSPLTYEQSFSLVTYVCLTSNSALYNAIATQVKGYSYGLLEEETLRLQAVSLLQAMSTREGIIGLRPEEIAGLVAATLELDTVVRVKTADSLPPFVMGGMGGDKGLSKNGEQSKLFSLSTLATLALADLTPIHKHHSYPNTSKIAGQSAIEALGARSDFTRSSDMESILDLTGVLMTSCHSIRTLHTISHVLKGETINHIIGPLAVPHNEFEKVNALIGVNQNVHPATIIETLKILQEKGIQAYGNSVAFCGLNNPIEHVPLEIVDPYEFYDTKDLKNSVVLDEVPPPPYTTMASFLVNGENTGTFLIAPTDFMEEREVQSLQVDHLLISNNSDAILAANEDVIKRQDPIKARYVAMTVALAIFTRDYVHLPDALDQHTYRVNVAYLRECYKTACKTMQNGKLEKRTRLYVEATQKDMLPGIDLVILDIDNTIVKPRDPNFYKQYSDAVNVAVSQYLNVSLEKGTRVADFYRQNLGGGEVALFSGTIDKFFPEYGEHKPNLELLYDAMCFINPVNEFINDGVITALIRLLRSQGKKVVALTDSPEDLSRRVLAEVGINPDCDFDLYLAYTREHGPHKILNKEQIFQKIADQFQTPSDRVLCVGDSYHSDIEPPLQLGMKACLISAQEKKDRTCLQARNINTVFETYRRSL